ncbi:hypothetical protein A2U01_0072504, partial [Trifolium medium]|nr:hypothetical protein [Trifolium medium]
QEKASEDKAKVVEATESEEKMATKKSKGKSSKKPRSERKKAPRVLRRLENQDDEDTDEGPW